MANSDVFIDDIRLQDLGITVRLNSQEPMLPDLRPNTIAIPGRHGAYDFGAFFDAREFLLDCVFKRQDYAALKRQIQEFVRMFVDAYGRPKTVKLRFGDEPEKWYNVKVSGGIPVERLAGFGTFTLPLAASDPFAYAEHDAYGPNIKQFNWTYYGRVIEIMNHSSLRTPLDITINGTVRDIKIRHVEPNKVMPIDGTYTSALIEIKSSDYTKTIYNKEGLPYFYSPSTPNIGGEEVKSNLFAVSNDDFIELHPGKNTVVFYGIDPNATVTLNWKHKFL